MKTKAVLAATALAGALAFSPASSAMPLAGTALSKTAITIDLNAVTKVQKRPRTYRKRTYRQRYASRRYWRPRYWPYQAYFNRPLLYDSPYYYSTSPYGYPFAYRFGSPYGRW